MASISSLGVGSGLDLSGLLDQLRSAERQKLTPITTQQKSYQAKISAFGKLESALEKFQTATAKLNDAKLYQSVSSKVTGSSITAASNADAPVGQFDVEVTALARSQSIATQGFEDNKFFAAGSLSIDLGSPSETLAIEVSADSTLEEIRDLINAEGAGVTASIVKDGSAAPNRLVLTTRETGTQAEITSMSFGAETSFTFATELDADGKRVATAESSVEQVAQARDASLTVNGIAITSQSNQVEGAIQGVTLSLAETGTAQVKVERNTLALREAVSGFVKAYNELKTSTSSLTSFNTETGDAGTLLGDGTLRSIESRLRSTLTSGVAEGDLRMLSDVGISLQLDGTLKLDEDKLSDLVSNEPAKLSQFFAGADEAGGLAGKLGQTLDQILSEKGLLDNATNGLENTIKSLGDRYTRMETSIEATIERYRKQFGQLDSMISNMNQTSAYLSQQFDMMNAQLGRDK